MNTNTIQATDLQPLANMTPEAVDDLLSEAGFPQELSLRPGLSMFSLCEAAIIRLSCSVGVLLSLETSDSVDATDRNTVSAARMLLEEAQGMLHAVRVGVSRCNAPAMRAHAPDA